MKVEVASIKEEGFLKEEDIDASLWDLDSSDIKFIEKINLCCEFRRVKDEILVRAEVSTHRKIRCNRCLEVTTKRITQNFYLTYSKKNLGRFLEVDRDIREEILLSYPMKLLCKDDCKGICPGCGRNLNYEECTCEKNSKFKMQNAKSHSKIQNSKVKNQN